MHKEAAFRALVAGAHEDGKLLLDLPSDGGDASRFVDVIGVVVLYIEAAHHTSAEAPEGALT